jgi:hypothetical protein
MSCVFQNIDPPPPSPPGEWVPPAFVAGGGHTRQGEMGGGGGHYFGRRKTQLCILPTVYRILFASSTSSVHSILTRAEFAKQKREEDPAFFLFSLKASRSCTDPTE